MKIIRRRAFARAGLIGNPSDGYNGKTISIIVKNFWAQVTLYEWDRLEIVPSPNDESAFGSIGELAKDVRMHGYYGGIRLVKASIKGFYDYCTKRDIPLHDRNFSIRYETTIPRQVGLAGSSAIVVATIRALQDFYGVVIPKHILPSFVLSIEKEQLGIMAGLQDRVAQVYEGCTYMNFAKDVMRTDDGFVHGEYESIPTDLLPPLYISFSAEYSEPTEVFHNNLRFRYDNGEPEVVRAMTVFAGLAEEVRCKLLSGEGRAIGSILDKNFDTRRSICRLLKEQILMVETARSVGASSKFAGSGGAVIGTYTDETMFKSLQAEMKKIGCHTIKPVF